MEVGTRSLWQKSKPLRYRLGRITRGYNVQTSLEVSATNEQVGLVGKTFKPTSAQALVEFVYVSIPMLFLFLGLFEFGVAYWNQQKLEQVTRETARRIAICQNNCDVYNDFALTGPDAFPLTAFWLTNNSSGNTPVASNYQLDPSKVNYIWFQRISNSGTITLSAEDQPPVISRSITATGDYKPLFRIYTYDGSGSAFPQFPFKYDVTYKSPYDGSSTPVNSVGWPSASYNVGATRYSGRSACEPTHRFFVQISWKHSWLSPIKFLPMGNIPINLVSRRAMKIEPRQFQLPDNAVCQDE